MPHQQVKFYQTGTLTVGNRLLDEAHRTVQATMDRSNSLDSGQRDRVPGGLHHPLSRIGLAHPLDALPVR
ncbi:MAG: hypothetical protein KZQ81_06630 [Candidatus Thiodiazotropha sp. (ex Rostrolucina anterorostrata)]|nr:hypothetical protein [Candidatus Thiodiazotropha sp. (ex Rostrolucina anterorostrata)]